MKGIALTQAIASWTRQQGPRNKQWRLSQRSHGFVLESAGQIQEFNGGEVSSLSVGRYWLVPVLKVSLDGSRQRLRGLGRKQAHTLSRAISHYLARHQVAADLEAVVGWRTQVLTTIDDAQTQTRWIPEETLNRLEEARPDFELYNRLRGANGVSVVLTEDERHAVDLMATDLRKWVADINESILRSELVSRKHFFDNVERSPLTEEQARAVVCFDNRVQVIAAAGSGKTSVMVARAAYAIQRGFVSPERCLLLAFNRAAAGELQERIDSSLEALGLPSQGLKASTFHAFGLNLIGQATGRKPRLAPWLDGGQDVGMVSRIVDELRDRSLDFRFKWDVFRLLYGRASNGPDDGEPDSWDPQERRTGFRTFRGEVVKSQGERLIADWLFLNGVGYQYERPYIHDVAGPNHSQYRPDFYYPKIDAWHEHWALGSDGKPPASFMGYAESMEWKKQLHRRYGTTLVETTWDQIMDTDGFRQLAGELTRRGLQLDWNPDQSIPGAKPIRHEDLARLVRTFMTHVKSNSLTPESLKKRLADGPKSLRTPRTRLFLDLYWQIHNEWQARLAAADAVDFEDMLVRAAEHLEVGDVTGRYDLVLVDEFQDASQARARLVQALVNKPGTYLMTVGDDWQSINRFAGADISVMTNFESWFGHAQTLRLQTTFRCPQSISDTAGSFVSKNPKQLRKQVRSANAHRGLPVSMLNVDSRDQIPEAIDGYLTELAEKLRGGGIKPDKGGKISVDVLGRYNFDRKLAPNRTPPGLTVNFRTVHSSKGLEADFIIIPNVTDGLYGFPSQIVDDPVLDAVMADPDDYPHSEERRLFYVALTRAKREIVLVTERGHESPFVAELVQEGRITIRNDESEAPISVCPTCRQGILVKRTGRYGEFYGCSRFPRCLHPTAGGPKRPDNLF